MPHPRLLTAFLLLLALTLPTRADTVTIDNRTFTLPKGFTIERVVAPPLALRPITIDFDERGRLYVADSSGSSAKTDQQLKEKPHRILRLEDTDGDGVFDRQTVFADRMMFPEGTMWLDGSLYVAAPPSIWKLTDTDDDGVADQRVEWFDGKTLTGCANDLHGPYAGPDGMIYWCKGAFAKQTYTLPNGKEFTTRASHIFRARPDGSGIEPVMTGGMDNPVDVVFTPAGERIFTTTFLQNPAGGKRDGLIHAVYGGVYGKQHDVIDGHVRTSPDLMPVLTHLGPAAPCGLHRYESIAFGAEYTDNLFSCSFNQHKVFRHVLTPDGATFKSKDEDFLTCDHVDFHPTDVIEDADGSLLIVDTGGWYKLCCPTSQLGKPDVLGAIYRVRKTDAKKLEDPRGLKIDWNTATPEALAKLLDDNRPAVRKRAINTLAAQVRPPSPKAANNAPSPKDPTAVGEGRGEGQGGSTAAVLRAIDQTLKNGSPRARLNAVWTACRLLQIDRAGAVRVALSDPDETVVAAACHAASAWHDPLALTEFIKLLSHRSPQVRRVAAEALGRIGHPRAAVPLYDALERAMEREPRDVVLHHSLSYALVETGLVQGVENQLNDALGDSTKPSALRSRALILLDLSASSWLQAMLPDPKHPEITSYIGALLASPDAGLRDTTAWIVARHPDWAEPLSNEFRQILVNPSGSLDPRTLRTPLTALAGTTTIQTLLSEIARRVDASREGRVVCVLVMGDANQKNTPAEWLSTLTELLAGPDWKVAAVAAETLRKLSPKQPSPALVAALLKLGANGEALTTARLSALAALPAASSKEAAGLPDVAPDVLGFLTALLKPEIAAALRLDAAEVLGRSKLSRAQLLALTEQVVIAGPLELDRLLAAFTQPSADDAVATQLLEALDKSKSTSSLRPDTLKARLKKFGPEIQKKSQPLLARLAPDAAAQTARLDELSKSLAAGDVRRGQTVFNSAKAACATCHAIGYLGGNVGPDLTRIGSIRQQRDLLESILYPSASFVQSFEPTIVETTDGDTHSGILKRNDPEELLLLTGPNQQQSIARKDVTSIRPGALSVMPAGLDQQLSPQELADLVAFLRACK